MASATHIASVAARASARSGAPASAEAGRALWAIPTLVLAVLVLTWVDTQVLRVPNPKSAAVPSPEPPAAAADAQGARKEKADDV